MTLTKVTGEVIQSSTSINANIAGNVTGDVTSTGISTFSGGVQLGTGTTISSPASNEFAISTNGTTRARIDSSGRLLVGTPSSSAEAKFIVQGGATASGGAMNIQRNGTTASAGSTIGFINFTNSANNVGASIVAEGDGTWTSGSSHPSRLVFSTTADGASSPTERMRITSAGFACINTQSPLVTNSVFNLRGNAASPAVATFRTLNAFGNYSFLNSSGTQVGYIQTSASSTTYSTSSDYRLKENVVPVTDGIARLQQLKPSRFNFITDPGAVVDGFIAHEVETVVPEAITGKKDAVDDEGNPQYQGIDQSKLVPLLTAALQEAIGRIETLEAEVAALKAQ